MILDFTCANYKSFKDEVRLDFLAAKSIREYRDDNITETGRYSVLRSAVVYGANASGKSNLLAGIDTMKWIVLNSSRNLQAGESLPFDPFRLHIDSADRPSKFEVTILLDEVRYRYGFQADAEGIRAEWLLRSPRIKEYPLFIREADKIQIFKQFPEGDGLESRTRNNALFLSVCSQLNGHISGNILTWFQNLTFVSGIDDKLYQQFTERLFLSSPENKKRIMDLLEVADLGIRNVEIMEEPVSDLSPSVPMQDDTVSFSAHTRHSHIATYHTIYDDTAAVTQTARLDFDSQESEGSKKYFRLSGPIIDTLLHGKVLVVDELDARLHPNLTIALVRLFNSKHSNQKNAQLIFATHDTNLLHAKLFRRDQVWFTEKNHSEATDLYALSEYIMPKGAKVRNDASFENDYIQGRYGAIPYIGDFRMLWIEHE